MQNNSRKWRIISGIAGMTFFIIANFTNFLTGLNVLAGVLQVTVNIFVFICWMRAYPRCRGFEKVVTFIGVVFPPIMAGITISRVLIPAIH